MGKGRANNRLPRTALRAAAVPERSCKGKHVLANSELVLSCFVLFCERIILFDVYGG